MAAMSEVARSTMIKVTDLNFTYPGASVPSLCQVSLEVNKGDFLAVIGGNGSGKSTLCKTLNGLIPHFISGTFEGSVLIDGSDTRNQYIGDLSLKVGYVYQDFENQIVCPTVMGDVSFASLNYAMTDYMERGRNALRLTGLSQKENDYIWQLSGGQKHLLALAGVLSLSPEVIILDEPAAQLDPAHARMIYDVLEDLNQKYGKTIIVIEHHTEYIARYCKQVALMKEGHILWKLPAADALKRVEELEGNNIFPPQVTLAARLLQKKGVLTDGFLPTTLSDGRNLFGGLKTCFSVVLAKEKERNRNTMPAVQFRGVSAEYRAVKGENKCAIRDFTLDIRKGDKIAMVGSNGAGKSTLMKLMIGLIKPSSGEVVLNGKATRDVSPEELAQMVSLVYQNPEEMFIMDSIRGDVEYAMKVRGVERYRQRADELLEIFHLKELGERDGRLLSGGQMRRASLAVGVALNPSLLLLDEPTANLDIATRKEMMAVLSDLSDQVETVIIATHDMQLVCEWADRIIVLSAGTLLADGDRETVFGDHTLVEASGICPPEIYEMGKCLSPLASCFTIEDFVSCFNEEGSVYVI